MKTAFSKALSTTCLFVRALALLVLIMIVVPPVAAQERASGEVKQIASDLYFYNDADGGANAAFLVTEEGVLLIDTLTHPRLARDLFRILRRTRHARHVRTLGRKLQCYRPPDAPARARHHRNLIRQLVHI